MTIASRALPAAAVRAGLAAAVAAALSACASGPGPATPEQLVERGERELARARGGPDLAPPPGLDAQRVEPGDPARAQMSLDEALRHLAPQRATADSAEISEADRREALKRYASGRALLREGDAASAARELADATAIDPTAGEAWILRAEAELASGQRSAGTRSLRRGVSLGAGEAVHRELLGREAMERREYEAAAAVLAEARLMDPGEEAPELALIVDAQLGAALEPLGYDTAARQLLLDVVPALAEAAPAGRFGPLIASAMRQQARYWTLVGDVSCRLGDYAGAFEAYRHAAAAPGADAAALAPARIYAALRAGAPSHAAAIALEAVDEAVRVERSGAALLEYVASADERAGAALQRALAARLQGTETEDAARASLAMALAALQSPADARRTLVEAHAASPHSAELIRAVARSAAEALPDEAVRLGSGMVRAAPARSAEIALAIVRAHRETAAIIESATASSDDAARLLGARALALAGRPGEGLEVLARISDPALALETAVARAQLGAAAGDFGAVEGAIGALAGDDTLEGRRAYSQALSQAHRYREAFDVMTRIVEQPDAPAGALVEAAWLALGLDEQALAQRWLDRAVKIDPSNEAAHELRTRVLSQVEPPEAARRQVTAAVNDLREALPASDLLDLIEIGGLIARGRLREAQELVLAIAEDPLRADEALRAGVEGLWTSRRRPDAELLEEARAWLALRAPGRPQSPATARALAAVLLALGRPEEAAEALREAAERFAWPELSVALEGVLRDALDRPGEADRLALERLGAGPAGIGQLVELAALRARRGELAEAGEALGRIPAPVHLAGDQAEQLASAARLSAEAADEAGGAAFAEAAAIFDEIERLGAEMPLEFHQRRLVMLVAWEDSTASRIAGALAHASAQVDEGADGLAAAVAGSLEQAGRAADALAAFEALAGSGQPLPAGTLDAWFVLIARAGNAADARRFIEASRGGGSLCPMLRRRGLDVEPGASKLDCAVLAVGILGDHWQSLERTEDMMEAFRLAHELAPEDPGPANDLGYTLLESRVELDEAARLIEMAHAADPESGAVLDSIGWLRYRQGVLEDERGPDGEVVREGAITLLERAAATPRGQVSATIQDHLGDALWRVGRRPAARLAWQTARGLAGNQRGGQAAEISQKLRDALRGGEPPVAEVYDEWP